MDTGDHSAKKASARNQRGTAAIEFGLLVPLLVALLLSGAEIGYFIQQTMVVNSAVEAGIAVAAKNGFDAKEIRSAILSNAPMPGMAVTPAPQLFCGCVASNSVAQTPCDTLCPGNVVPGHYLTVGAQITAQTILPRAMLPLPSQIAVKSTTRLN
jgi:Flp pilus assembly protein TadG